MKSELGGNLSLSNRHTSEHKSLESECLSLHSIPKNRLRSSRTKGPSSHPAFDTGQALRDKYAVAREEYKPTRINVLFIAESPPSSGGYFYFERTIGKDHLFRETMKALKFWPLDRPMRKGCDKRPMLNRFLSRGFFLIDTCELPVDNLGPVRRRILTIQGALTLPKRVQKLDPGRILIVKKTIFNPVKHVLNDAGFGERILNAKPLPFPSHGNQSKFRTMMRRLVKQE
jgi:hypothetical protein